MKKLIFLLTLLISINIQSQDYARQSLEMSYGENLFTSPLGTSLTSSLVNTGYRYMITPKFGLQTFVQFDVLRSGDQPHDLCEYRAYAGSARLELYRRLARFGRFNIAGHTGIGGMYVWTEDQGRERMFNYTAGLTVLYGLGKTHKWGALKLDYMVIGNTMQDRTINNNFEIDSHGINSYFQNLSLGFAVYLDNNKKKPEHADWYSPVVSVKSLEREKKKEECCEQDINVYPTSYEIKEIVAAPVSEHIFFDFDSNEIKARSRNATEKTALFAKQNPQYDIVLEGWSCLSSESYYNRVVLPKKRTAILKALLISKGVDGDRIIESPQGIDRTQVEEINHAFARRVDVKFVKK